MDEYTEWEENEPWMGDLIRLYRANRVCGIRYGGCGKPEVTYLFHPVHRKGAGAHSVSCQSCGRVRRYIPSVAYGGCGTRRRT